MKKAPLIVLILFCCLLHIHSQDNPWRGKSVDFSHGKLIIAPGGRYLQHQDGTPFFYLGDTSWELFHRLDEAEVREYMENRRSKGFTVIQAVILAELDGLNTPTPNGERPLINNQITTPNENYFKWVDKVIRIAEEKGLYIGLLPTWGDKVDKQWGVGPEIFTPENAALYGNWLGKRYKDFPNIIWINGGDRSGGGNNFSVWDALGKALREADDNHLITFHPFGEASSGEWFHNCDWLDFNMAQTGHCQTDYAIYERLIQQDYNRTPIKPCMDSEPRYENHPICWKPDSLGWFDDVDVRQAMYWNLFSGSLGHTYGCHDIWQFKNPARKAEGFARGDWRSSMDLSGAFHLIHARRLAEKFGWNNQCPAPEMILSENTSTEDRIVALQGKGYAFVYFPQGNKATLDLSKTSKDDFYLEWMNPRTGDITNAGKHKSSSAFEIIPPSSGRGNDWVLIIQE